MAESTDDSNDNNNKRNRSQAHADDEGARNEGEGDEHDQNVVEELAEETQSMLREYADSLRDFGRQIVAVARRNPIPASLVAVAAGYLVGRMTRRLT